MADPIESFLADYQNETLHIPEQRLTCCCGNEACAYLRHNQSALDGLEKDVSTAARLGKALLIRHEAYISDSERERKAMAEHIESLEADKQSLEKRNATVIEENRSLLDQLEALNNAVADSDAHVMSLQATLTSTQQEFHKLTQLASRTERLEQQIVDFEREQAVWHSSLESKEESEKSAVRRWQKAERTLSSLQEQMERIEQEAKEEKDRHAEIVGRMDRRHAVEKELNSAAGRLKGAAASKAGEMDGAGPNVVSHFVKDILQDNANLQMGIVELREMLNNSNDEVENLRNKVTLHQPADEEEDTPKANISRKDLNAELTRANSSELHVHHHYHAPPPTPKAQAIRRPKKKRIGPLAQGYSTPNSGASTPRSSFSYATPTSTAAILQQTAASLPQPVPARSPWSTQTNQTYNSTIASSGPSSPQSTTNRTSSIFDRVFSDAGEESSRPTTPDTEHPGSPVLAPGNSKRGSGTWTRTYSAPLMQRQSNGSRVVKPTLDSILSIEESPKLGTSVQDYDVIHEETEAEWEEETSKLLEEEDSSVTSPMSDKVLRQESLYRPPLRKAASHESLLSVSGMDIHTLQSRPSQLLAPYAGRAITSKASISDATAHTAQPVAMSRASGNSKNLLSGMAADLRQPNKPTLGKKVGGWMFGKWGATPAPATTDIKKLTQSKTATKPSNVSTSTSDKTATDAQATPKKPNLRLAGINQSGPLLGFFPEVAGREVVPPRMTSLDKDALKRALDGS